MNEELSIKPGNLTIFEYIKIINEKFYKIDLSVMDDLIGLVGKDECCIDYNIL